MKVVSANGRCRLRKACVKEWRRQIRVVIHARHNAGSAHEPQHAHGAHWGITIGEIALQWPRGQRVRLDGRARQAHERWSVRHDASSFVGLPWRCRAGCRLECHHPNIFSVHQRECGETAANVKMAQTPVYHSFFWRRHLIIQLRRNSSFLGDSNAEYRYLVTWSWIFDLSTVMSSIKD